MRHSSQNILDRGIPSHKLSRVMTFSQAKRYHVAALIDTSQYYTRSVLAGVWQFVRIHGDWVCESDIPFDETNMEWLLKEKWDGIVACAADPKMIRFLEKSKIPIVNVSNAAPPTDAIPRVVSDDYAIGKLAAEHFLERGLRNFAFLGLKNYQLSKLRMAGFEDALKAAGFRSDRLWADFHHLVGRRLRTEIPGIAELLAKGRSPLGIFCATDLYARHVIGCCVQNDIHVPEQVAVVGVDNSEMANGLVEIPFSSVEPQFDKIGYAAMELLADLIAGGNTPKSPILIPPKHVVVRASSDLLAVDDQMVVRALRAIRQRAYQPVQIDDIMREVPLSRRMLEKRFKAAVGRSPYAEVLRLRVEKAKALLKDTDLSVAEVAELSGFGQAKQLHAIFTREAGDTPSGFRKKFRFSH